MFDVDHRMFWSWKEYTPPVDNYAEMKKIVYQSLKTMDPEELAILEAKSKATLRRVEIECKALEPTEAQKAAVIGLGLGLLTLYCLIWLIKHMWMAA